MRDERAPIGGGSGRSAGAWSFALSAILSVATLLASPAASVETGDRSTLAERLDRLLAASPLDRARVGLLVVRASDGATLYARDADRLLVPASNQKILTSLASLARFGPSHRFSTRVWAPEAPDADGLVDSLLVEGGGDPVMNSEDWWRLAADLRREGLRGVRGDLFIDDSRFEEPGWHPSWGRISARAYHAPVGALTANYGTFFVSVWPHARIGAPARVVIDPPVDYLRLRNEARTTDRKARPRLSVDRAPGRKRDGPPDEVVRVDGVARRGDEGDSFPRSVLDPGLYAGSLFAHQLAANDVELDGEVLRGAEREAYPVLLLDRPGRTLAEATALCMKYSNNSIAESLVKNLGAWAGAASDAEPPRQGDWAGGIRAMRRQLEALGLDLGDARIIDGSGLSTQNRVSARMLVAALSRGRDAFAFGPEFVASLPIAELDGTLEKRLRGSRGRIRAKTGLLSDAKVSALSGFAERADGETLVFAILVNGHAGGSGGAMRAVDRLAASLLEAPAPVAEPEF